MSQHRPAVAANEPDIAIDADTWRPPQRELRLDAGDVRVWRIALDLPSVDIAALNALVLSPDERARTAHFRRPIDGARFGAGVEQPWDSRETDRVYRNQTSSTDRG